MKEFKEEFNSELKQADYIGRKIGKRIAIFVLVVVVLIGLFGIGYTYTIGKWQTNAEREVFKSSIAYTEQASSFLAKSYKEYNSTTDKSERQAIMEYVALRYPDLEADSIDNITLKNLLMQL